MKIAVLSWRDYANAGWHLARAISTHPDNEATIIIEAENTTFGYPRDIVIKNGDLDKAKDIVRTADIIHIKGDEPLWKFDKLMSYHFGVKSISDFGKPLVLTVEGSIFRRVAGKKKPFAHAMYPEKDYENFPGLKTASTADLNYPWFKGIYTQQSINSRKEPRIWKMKSPPVICHSPSSPKKKATHTLFFPALEILKKRGIKFEVSLLQKMSHVDCLKQKKQATIFFDQGAIGFYGYSALEAAQWGIPTVAWISPEAIKQSDGKISSKTPITSFAPTPEGLANTFQRLLESDLEALSIRTKEWMDSFHSYETVGNMWGKIYEKLL